MFSFLTFQTFLEGLPVSIHSSMLTRNQRRMDSFLSKGLTIQIIWKTKKFPKFEAFQNKLPNCNNPVERECLGHEKLMGSGLTTENALVKKNLSEMPPSGAENYCYWQKVREQENMHKSLKGFFRWYNNKNIVPTLEVL